MPDLEADKNNWSNGRRSAFRPGADGLSALELRRLGVRRNIVTIVRHVAGEIDDVMASWHAQPTMYRHVLIHVKR